MKATMPRATACAVSPSRPSAQLVSAIPPAPAVASSRVAATPAIVIRKLCRHRERAAEHGAQEDDVAGVGQDLGEAGRGQPGGIPVANALPFGTGAGDLRQHEEGEAGRHGAESEDPEDLPRRGQPRHAHAGEPDERRDCRDGARDRQPARSRRSQGVGDEGDGRRPRDAAGRVPDREPAPGHAIGAGEPRRRDTTHDHPAAEEDRGRAVRGEEAVTRLDEAPSRACERAGGEQHPPAEPATEQVADVVADDRGRRRQRDHQRDVQPPLGGEHGGGDQRRLRGDRYPGRLERDGGRDRDIPDVAGEADDAHGEAARLRRRPGGAPPGALGRAAP